jgi:hypothetical protein
LAISSLLSSRDGVPDDGYFRAGTALSRILCEAPYLARCSDDKTATRLRPRQYAIAYPYMQINRPGMTSWLIFDLDHPVPSIWESAGLPAPNLIVRNRHTNHSHLFWAIEPVCTSEKGRSRPISYMRAIYAAMSARLKADPHFASGPVAKVPGHPWWRTEELHHKVHSLGDLAEYVDLAPRVARRATGEGAHSRHCILFEALRLRAYALVGREARGGYEAFFDRVLSEAYALNHFAQEGFSRNLPLSSLRATAKSVARYTWERRDALMAAKRGAMQLDPSLPLLERQRLAAARTARLRTSDTEARIRSAIADLGERGVALTGGAIAAVAGVSRRTVARYAGRIPESQFQPQQQPVPFGGPQVSAPLPTASPPSGSLKAVLSSGKRLSDASSSPRQGATTNVDAPDASGDGLRLVSTRRTFLEPVLEELRGLPLHQVVELIGGHRAVDRSYRAIKDPRSERWHVSSERGDFELLVTGAKWYDTRAERGGGGAIDLVMHLTGDTFAEAVARLQGSRSRPSG